MAEDETPDETPAKHLRKLFPYYDVYKVRNMFFALDIPVFTALEEHAEIVKDGHIRFKYVYCCN